MTRHKCSRCGHEFEAADLPNAVEDIALRRKPYVPLDRYLTVTCPKCGHVEDAVERRFFGIFGPRAIRRFLFLFVAAVIAAVGYVLFKGLW